jgi:hypothetical protein
VAADDDVLHAQCQHRVFDGSGNAAIHLPVRRNDVADVTGDEQIARRAVGDELGNDARVGAGNEHRPWLLRRGEFLEQFFLLWKNLVMKMQKTVNDMLQRCIGGLRLLWG